MQDLIVSSGDADAFLITPMMSGFYTSYGSGAKTVVIDPSIVTGSAVAAYSEPWVNITYSGAALYSPDNANKLGKYVATVTIGNASTTYSGGVLCYNLARGWGLSPNTFISTYNGNRIDTTEFPGPNGNWLTSNGGAITGTETVLPSEADQSIFPAGVYYDMTNSTMLHVSAPNNQLTNGALMMLVNNPVNPGEGVVFNGPWYYQNTSKHEQIRKVASDFTVTDGVWSINLYNNTYTAFATTYGSITIEEPPHCNWHDTNNLYTLVVNGDNALCVEGSRYFHTLGHLTADPSVAVYDESGVDGNNYLWKGSSGYILRTAEGSSIINTSQVQPITCIAVPYFPLNGMPHAPFVVSNSGGTLYPMGDIRTQIGVNSLALVGPITAAGRPAVGYGATYFNFNPDVITDSSAVIYRNFYHSSSYSATSKIVSSEDYYCHFHYNEENIEQDTSILTVESYWVGTATIGDPTRSVRGLVKNADSNYEQTTRDGVVQTSAGNITEHIRKWLPNHMEYEAGVAPVIQGYMPLSTTITANMSIVAAAYPYYWTGTQQDQDLDQNCVLVPGPILPYEVDLINPVAPLGSTYIDYCIPMLSGGVNFDDPAHYETAAGWPGGGVTLHGETHYPITGDDCSDQEIDADAYTSIDIGFSLYDEGTQPAPSAMTQPPSEINVTYTITDVASGGGTRKEVTIVATFEGDPTDPKTETGWLDAGVTLIGDWTVPPTGGGCASTSSGASVEYTVRANQTTTTVSHTYQKTSKNEYRTGDGYIHSYGGVMTSQLENADTTFPSLYSGYTGVYCGGLDGAYQHKPSKYISNWDSSWYLNKQTSGGNTEFEYASNRSVTLLSALSGAGITDGSATLTGTLNGGIMSSPALWQVSGCHLINVLERIHPVGTGSDLCYAKYRSFDPVPVDVGSARTIVSRGNAILHRTTQDITITGETPIHTTNAQLENYHSRLPVVSEEQVQPTRLITAGGLSARFTWVDDTSNNEQHRLRIQERLEVDTVNSEATVIAWAVGQPPTTIDTQVEAVIGEAWRDCWFDYDSNCYKASAGFIRTDVGNQKEAIMPVRVIPPDDPALLTVAILSGAQVFNSGAELTTSANNLKINYELESQAVDAVAARSAAHLDTGGRLCSLIYSMTSTSLINSGAVIFNYLPAT